MAAFLKRIRRKIIEVLGGAKGRNTKTKIKIFFSTYQAFHMRFHTLISDCNANVTECLLLNTKLFDIRGNIACLFKVACRLLKFPFAMGKDTQLRPSATFSRKVSEILNQLKMLIHASIGC